VTESSDDLDQKMVRVADRVKAHGVDVRARMGAVPDLLAFADACKSTFHGKLKWLRIGEWSQGHEPTPGIAINPQYRAAKKRR